MPLTAEQLAIRKVGGSDVATILGLNPFKTALELYHEKRGTIEPVDLSDNLPVQAGNALEDAIAELTADRLSRRWNRPVKLRRCNLTLTHPKYDWLTVHIDRDVVGEERGVELKNVGYHAARGWGASDTDEIPEYYLPQPHTYMLVKNYPVWTTSGFFGGADLRLYEISRDKGWDELIIERTHQFWQCVETGTPPAIDLDVPRAYDVLRRVYAGTNGETIVASEDDEHWRAVLQRAAELKRQYEEAEKIAKAHLLSRMGDNAVLSFIDGSFLERRYRTRKGYTVEPGKYLAVQLKKTKGKLIEGESSGETD